MNSYTHLFFMPIKVFIILILLSSIVACRFNASNANLDHQEIVTNTSNTHIKELLQTDTNRMTTLAMRNNLHSIYILLNKFYKRNPNQWQKIANTQQDAEKIVHEAIEKNQPLPGLAGKQSVEALHIALSPDFQGDRAGALAYATATMIIQAHGGHSEFYMADIIDAEYLYNAARNIEIAQWMLKEHKDANGKALLVSNEISEHGYNLNFAIEAAKIVARLDLIASVLDEKYRRIGINYAQNLFFFTFLPVQ